MEGVIVAMHEGACDTGGQIMRPLARAHMCSKRVPLHSFLPLLRQVVPLNDGYCRLTIPVVKGRCAREALPHVFNIGLFKYGKSNSTTIKHIHNESEHFDESCDIALDGNN